MCCIRRGLFRNIAWLLKLKFNLSFFFSSLFDGFFNHRIPVFNCPQLYLSPYQCCVTHTVCDIIPSLPYVQSICNNLFSSLFTRTDGLWKRCGFGLSNGWVLLAVQCVIHLFITNVSASSAPSHWLLYIAHCPGINADLSKFDRVMLTLRNVFFPTLTERGHPCKSHFKMKHYCTVCMSFVTDQRFSRRVASGRFLWAVSNSIIISIIFMAV